MARTGVIAVPRVLYVDRNVLVLEYIENSAARDRLFFRRFGEALAAMHLSFQEKYGFFEDNYIGATPQKNLPEVAYEKSAKNSSHWARFYFENRLLFQFKLLEKKGFTADIQRLFGKMEKRVYELIGEKENEPPALLHGDLWSGNFLASPQVGPVLIDPAVYRGDREADLAMTTLFGGFDAEFYRGYQERYPLDPHYREREGLYHLYHIMNHVNLFGGGYYGQLRSILQRYQ
jgi:fructosamine-3-kinase